MFSITVWYRNTTAQDTSGENIETRLVSIQHKALRVTSDPSHPADRGSDSHQREDGAPSVPKLVDIKTEHVLL